MQRVFILDADKKPLMPCTLRRARQLLKQHQAAVYRRHPFTLILKHRHGGEVQPVELKVDPGSKVTGLALVAEFQGGRTVVWAGELEHRGWVVKKALDRRRMARRSRRSRKTRHRAPRFANRKYAKGWLPPSLRSRVDNIYQWGMRLTQRAPIVKVHTEIVRFDTQQLANPEITGVEYQRGTLFGYEVKEYLLEKWEHQCAYCGKEGVPLEIEHIVPRSRGGSDRVSNLTLACHDCNQRKGSQTAAEFGYPEVQAQAQRPLRDATAMNATRYAIGDRLKELGLPVGFWSGGRTKHNRVVQGYPKTHWIDATCVGETGVAVHLSPRQRAIQIRALGRGHRQVCRTDRHGFPCAAAKTAKRINQLQMGDVARLTMVRGKYVGRHVGYIAAVRKTGTVDLRGVKGKITAPFYRFSVLQKADGYAYSYKEAM